jgi:exopolyphosphatase/pppGpp-phosphohydrolase
MHPGRADVIAAGALIMDRIMAVLGFGEVLASEHDILDGIAWSLVSGGRAGGGADASRATAAGGTA